MMNRRRHQGRARGFDSTVDRRDNLAASAGCRSRATILSLIIPTLSASLASARAMDDPIPGFPAPDPGQRARAQDERLAGISLRAPLPDLAGVELLTAASPHRRISPRLTVGLDPNSRPTTVPIAVWGLLSIAFDSPIHHWTFRHWRGGASDTISQAGSDLGGFGGAAALGAAALLEKGSHRSAAWEAASGAVDAEIVTTAIKFLVGRRRPAGGDGLALQPFRGDASFPSGHTTFAFAVARVYAVRYPRYRWLAYGLASFVGLSRIQSNQHFLSDVLVGSAVGINGGQRALDGKVSLLDWKF